MAKRNDNDFKRVKLDLKSSISTKIRGKIDELLAKAADKLQDPATPNNQILTKNIGQIRQDSLLGIFKRKMSSKVFLKKNFFVVLNPTEMFISGGIDEEFSRNQWAKLTLSDVMYTARGKPLTLFTSTGQEIIKNNPLLDKSAPKPILIHDKSKGPLSAYVGHIKVKLDNKQPNAISEKNEVFEIPYGDAKLFLTYERQDLHYIQTQIQTLPPAYEVIECHPNANPPYFIIKDQENETFMVELTDFNEKRMLRTSVSKTKTIFSRIIDSAKQILQSISLDQNVQHSPKTKTAFENFVSAHQNTWNLNINRTVKLLPCNKQAQGVWEVDRRPDVACDAEGNPIKGDVDLQTAILSQYLPPDALRLIDTNPVVLLEQFIALKNSLAKAHQDIAMETKDFPQLEKIIAKAILKLKKHIEDHPSNDKSEILHAMGNINIFNAAIVLGLDSVILHGDEGTSPLWPECIILSQTPNPNGDGTFINTYSEFEYYKLLLANEDILRNKTISINPCWLVADEEGRWRRMKVETEYIDAKGNKVTEESYVTSTLDHRGDVHECDNLRDENYNIFMIRLICELNLLQYKQNRPNDYQRYLDIQLKNYEIMINREKAKRAAFPIDDKRREDNSLILQLEAGIKVFKAIADNVELTTDIPARIEKIRNVARIDISDTPPFAPMRKGASMHEIATDQALDVASANANRSYREEMRRNIDKTLKDNLTRMMLEDNLELSRRDYNIV